MASRYRPPEEDGYIYIDELCAIIDRMPSTVRMWEREGRLPKRLMPTRRKRNWRAWTNQQVHGKNGIVAWMKKNDLRPANALARYKPDEDKVKEHVAHLRRPKYLKEYHMDIAKQFANRGWYIEQIAEELLPLTRYQSIEGLIRVLTKAFKAEGLEIPPSALREERQRQKEKNYSQSSGAKAQRKLRAQRRAEAAGEAA